MKQASYAPAVAALRIGSVHGKVGVEAILDAAKNARVLRGQLLVCLDLSSRAEPCPASCVAVATNSLGHD